MIVDDIARFAFVIFLKNIYNIVTSWLWIAGCKISSSGKLNGATINKQKDMQNMHNTETNKTAIIKLLNW